MKVAQLRKISTLIDKVRLNNSSIVFFPFLSIVIYFIVFPSDICRQELRRSMKFLILDAVGEDLLLKLSDEPDANTLALLYQRSN